MLFANKAFANSLVTTVKRQISRTAQDVLRGRGDQTLLSKLNNGLRVATLSNGNATATVGVWVDSGSQYETKENNGVASLWELLFTSGTSSRSAEQLQRDLAKIGARLNAYTGREHTAYYVQCQSVDVERAVEILADVLRNTKLDEARVQQYKTNLMKEVEDNESNYRQMVFDYLHMTAFQNTGLEKSPLGQTKSVGSLTLQDVENFVDDTFKPVRMVLTGVGGVDHDQLEKLGQKYFGDLRNEYKRRLLMKEPCRFTGSEMHFRHDDIPLMYGAVGVEAVPRGHADFLPLQILNTAMGSWNHSDKALLNSPTSLVQRICSHPDLVAYESFLFGYDTAGLLGYYIVTNAGPMPEATDLFREIHKEWRYWATSVTEAEVDRAKNKLKTNLFLDLEDSVKAAQHISTEVIGLNRITPFDELERQITVVNADGVHRSVLEHIYGQDIAIAGVGRTYDFPSYHLLRGAMTWWRL